MIAQHHCDQNSIKITVDVAGLNSAQLVADAKCDVRQSALTMPSMMYWSNSPLSQETKRVNAAAPLTMPSMMY